MFRRLVLQRRTSVFNRLTDGSQEFVELAAEANEIGFSGVMSGPLVRSSYRAGRLYKQAQEAKAALNG